MRYSGDFLKRSDHDIFALLILKTANNHSLQSFTGRKRARLARSGKDTPPGFRKLLRGTLHHGVEPLFKR